MNDDRNPEVLKQWLDANPDKKGTPDYETVKMGYDRLTRIAGYKQELVTANKAEVAGVVADYLLNVGKDFAKAAGIKGGPAAIGQVLGGIAGERVAGRAGRKIGERVGGAVGAGAGSVAYQVSERGEVRGGETLTDIAAGALQTKGLTTSGLTNMALDVVRQKIDEGKVDWESAAAAGAGAAAGSMIANRIAGNEVTPQDAMMVNRIKAFEEVRPYGIVANPAELATELTMMQRVGVPSAISAKAAHVNQAGWQKMVREQIGLPLEGDLTFQPTTFKLGKQNKVLGTLDVKKEQVSQPYRDIADISKGVAEEIKLQSQGQLQNPRFLRANVTPEGVEAMLKAKENLEALKQMRYQRKGLAKKAAMGDPEARTNMRVLLEQEQALEGQLDKAAIASGDLTLVDRLTKAREELAVLNIVDDATTTYGTVDPAVIYAFREAGAPLTGNLEKIALFYDAFKPSATEIVQAGPVQGMGVSMAYTARNIATGNPTGGIAAGIPVVSEAVRDYLLAPNQQQAALRPVITQRPDSATAALVRQGSRMGAPELGDREMDPYTKQVVASWLSSVPMATNGGMLSGAPYRTR